MRRTLAAITMISIIAKFAMSGPWVPVSVNTNTWECKPYYPGTNYWNNLGTATGAVDTTPPTIIAFSPIDGAAAVAPTAELVATFSEQIVKGIGNITITNVTDSTSTNVAVGAANVQVSGTTMTINPSVDLLNLKDYAVLMDSGVVKDTANNSFAGISLATTWNFTTAEAVPDAYSNALFYLSMAQDESPLQDQSTNNNDFTESSTTWGSHSITLTEASESYIASQNTGIGDDSTELTQSFWIKYNDTPVSYDFLLNCGKASQTQATQMYILGSTLVVWLWDVENGVGNQVTPTCSFPVGDWVHIVAAYQKVGAYPNQTSTLNIYRNSTNIYSTTTAYNMDVSAADTWYFGYSPWSSFQINDSIDATIDDVAVIPDYWDATTVTNIYTAGRSE